MDPLALTPCPACEKPVSVRASAQHEDDVLVLGSIHLRSELAAGLPKLVLKLLLHAIPCRLLTLR